MGPQPQTRLLVVVEPVEKFDFAQGVDTGRVVQDFRALNALLKEQSRGLGNLPTIFDEMSGSNDFTCSDLASGFLQITIRESDRHLTAFHDAEGK